MHCLKDYHWKGNVRELENLIQRLAVMIDDEIISASQLPPHILSHEPRFKPGAAANNPCLPPLLPESGLDFDQELQRYEYELLRAAIARAGGVKTRAAELLRLNKDKMKYLFIHIQMMNAVPD